MKINIMDQIPNTNDIMLINIDTFSLYEKNILLEPINLTHYCIDRMIDYGLF